MLLGKSFSLFGFVVSRSRQPCQTNPDLGGDAHVMLRWGSAFGHKSKLLRREEGASTAAGYGRLVPTRGVHFLFGIYFVDKLGIRGIGGQGICGYLPEVCMACLEVRADGVIRKRMYERRGLEAYTRAEKSCFCFFGNYSENEFGDLVNSGWGWSECLLLDDGLGVRGRQDDSWGDMYEARVLEADNHPAILIRLSLKPTPRAGSNGPREAAGVFF